MTRGRAGAPDLRAQLLEWADDNSVELIFFDPPEHFDHAILGVITGYGQEPAILYDEAAVLDALAKDLGEDGAREWFDVNTVGAYLGEATPRFLTCRLAAPARLADPAPPARSARRRPRPTPPAGPG